MNTAAPAIQIEIRWVAAFSTWLVAGRCIAHRTNNPIDTFAERTSKAMASSATTTMSTAPRRSGLR